MNICIILICILLLMSAVLVCVYRCRRMLKKKDRALFRQIHEKDRLKRELEHTYIENETLKNLLSDKLDISVQIRDVEKHKQ